MLALYYKIWVDAIVAEQSKKGRERNWKLFTIIPISLLQGVNLLTFFYWMKVIVNKNLPLYFGVDIFNAHPLNGFISVVLTLFVPFVILNYLLIFVNDRYVLLIKQYPYKRGIVYRRYVMGSL
jgi:K+-sensing histidine kinase KdpD